MASACCSCVCVCVCVWSRHPWHPPRQHSDRVPAPAARSAMRTKVGVGLELISDRDLKKLYMAVDADDSKSIDGTEFAEYLTNAANKGSTGAHVVPPVAIATASLCSAPVAIGRASLLPCCRVVAGHSPLPSGSPPWADDWIPSLGRKGRRGPPTPPALPCRRPTDNARCSVGAAVLRRQGPTLRVSKGGGGFHRRLPRAGAQAMAARLVIVREPGGRRAGAGEALKGMVVASTRADGGRDQVPWH